MPSLGRSSLRTIIALECDSALSEVFIFVFCHLGSDGELSQVPRLIPGASLVWQGLGRRIVDTAVGQSYLGRAPGGKLEHSASYPVTLLQTDSDSEIRVQCVQG